MRKIDLTGQTYGFFQVKEKDPNRKGYWICQCVCGNYKSIAGKHLRSGATVSCGCYGDKRRKENLKKYNEYDLSGEYGIGKIDNSDITFLFDKEDYDKIKDICWHVQSAGYIYGVLDGKDISFHRYVMDAKEGEIVDHINHKVRDNRKNNLRICTQNDNIINKKQLPTVGVRQAKSGRWFAEITAYKKYHWLGTYDTKEEAIEARKKGEEKYFGEYAYKEET